jgi:hypothetical protein
MDTSMKFIYFFTACRLMKTINILRQEKLGEKIELIFKIPEELKTYKIHKMLPDIL